MNIFFESLIRSTLRLVILFAIRHRLVPWVNSWMGSLFSDNCCAFSISALEKSRRCPRPDR